MFVYFVWVDDVEAFWNLVAYKNIRVSWTQALCYYKVKALYSDPSDPT